MQRAEGRCPECGAAVQLALAPRQLVLQEGWVLRRLQRAVGFLCVLEIVGALAEILRYVVDTVGFVMHFIYYHDLYTTVIYTSHGVDVLLCGLWVVAAWWLTAVPCVGLASKVAVRSLAVLALLLHAGLALMTVLMLLTPGSEAWMSGWLILALLTIVESTLAYLALVIVTGVLLRRAGRRGLAMHLWIAVGVSLSVRMLLTVAMLFLLWELGWAASEEIAGLERALQYVRVASGVFLPLGLWVLLATVLAWLAFRRLYRQRRAMREGPLVGDAVVQEA